MGAKQGSETRPLLPRVWGSDRDEFVTWKLIDSQTALLEQTSLLGREMTTRLPERRRWAPGESYSNAEL